MHMHTAPALKLVAQVMPLDIEHFANDLAEPHIRAQAEELCRQQRVARQSERSLRRRSNVPRHQAGEVVPSCVSRRQREEHLRDALLFLQSLQAATCDVHVFLAPQGRASIRGHAPHQRLAFRRVNHGFQVVCGEVRVHRASVEAGCTQVSLAAQVAEHGVTEHAMLGKAAHMTTRRVYGWAFPGIRGIQWLREVKEVLNGRFVERHLHVAVACRWIVLTVHEQRGERKVESIWHPGYVNRSGPCGDTSHRHRVGGVVASDTP
mmetsp:Transcript_56082/g.114185  ORF Transcript_56082/g.114185 Transcript_56082/m.114185 type:complete len:263 (-) Transcript_56082:1702-2490(-)